MSNDYSEKEYWDDVESIAKEALEECSTDEDAYDRIHESVDGSAWIIYTHATFKVMSYTDNREAYTDNFGNEFGKDADYDRITQLMAYGAMEADVMQKYQELKEAKEEAETEE